MRCGVEVEIELELIGVRAGSGAVEEGFSWCRVLDSEVMKVTLRQTIVEVNLRLGLAG